MIKRLLYFSVKKLSTVKMEPRSVFGDMLVSETPRHVRLGVSYSYCGSGEASVELNLQRSSKHSSIG